jgi:hypothetical protein
MFRSRHEVVRRNICLAKQAHQRSGLHFAVKGHDASGCATSHHDMAATLSNLFEAQALQCPDDFCARKYR